MAASVRFWTRHVGYGLGLGLCISLLEFAHHSPLAPEQLGLLSLASLLVSWCGEGVLLALAVGLAERQAAPRLLGARPLAAAVAAGAILGVPAWQAFAQFVLRERFGVWLFPDHVGQPVNMASVVLYHTWFMLLFGGLASALDVSRQRHERMLASLRAAELGRESSQRRLAEARLATLHARIDPDFLFQTLARLEKLYETDPHGADRLLEELIAFLRRALADIRTSLKETPT